MPGSAATYSLTQIRNLFVAPVWHPADQPPLPPIVAVGRPPNVRACGSCHRANGSGGPENANIAGLPPGYMRRALEDFRAGLRDNAVPPRAPSRLMIETMRDITDAEIEEAVAFFAALRRQQAIRVLETDIVPVTRVVGWVLEPVAGGGTEPIGQRIIEVPDDPQAFHNRDGRARFTAHVPPGSVERGRALAAEARTGGACVSCHGADLRGAADVPSLAGKSPSYIVRQLHDFRSGVRRGSGAAPMRENAAGLSLDDMIALAAYAASLSP